MSESGDGHPGGVDLDPSNPCDTATMLRDSLPEGSDEYKGADGLWWNICLLRIGS